MTPEELGRHVREAFAYLARYVSLLAAGESASRLLSRPDVDAVIADTLAQGRRLTGDAVRQAWAENGGPPHQYLSWLIDDTDRAYELTGEIRRAVRRDHADGPAVVRGGVLDLGAHAALRSQLIAYVAATAARTMKEIEEGAVRQSAGAHVWKQWLCKTGPDGRPDERTCHWCRALHRVVVPLHGNFPLGTPADLTGHGHLTRPPRPYHHVLPGPPRHPRCRCRIVILTNLPAHQVISPPGGQEAAGSPAPLGPAQPGKRPPKYPGLLAASDVRAMDEGRYQALVHFLSAAVHELGQVLARLRRVFRA